MEKTEEKTERRYDSATRLADLRRQKGVSQREVAKALGIERSTYVKYETGLSRPTRSLQKLAEYYDVTVDYIMGIDPPKKEKFTPLEVSIIRNFRKLPADDQEEILSIIDMKLQKLKKSVDFHYTAWVR